MTCHTLLEVRIMTLRNSLESLRDSPKSHTFNVVEVPEREGIFVGVDSSNRPCIFVKSIDINQSPSIRTAKLQVEFHSEYHLYAANQETIGNFHSIKCLSTDEEDIKVFNTVLDSIIADSRNQLTAYSLASVFYSLVNLFQVGASPDLGQAREGLWGELFFMKNFGGFSKWAFSWHSEPSRLFDFSVESKRVEVKSTLRSERIHDFSHNQLFSLASEDITIISLLLREDDSGLSLQALVQDAIAALKGTQYFIKLERAIIRAGMTDFNEIGPRYNDLEAKRNLAFIKAENVPKFMSREPEGVSGTHYKSDLTPAQKMSEEEIARLLASWH